MIANPRSDSPHELRNKPYDCKTAKLFFSADRPILQLQYNHAHSCKVEKKCRSHRKPEAYKSSAMVRAGSRISQADATLRKTAPEVHRPRQRGTRSEPAEIVDAPAREIRLAHWCRPI